MGTLNRSTFTSFIFGQMEKLDRKEISVQDAIAQAALARQAYNALNYERQRAETLLKLKGTGIEIREIEDLPNLEAEAEIVIKVSAIKKVV